MLSRSAKAEMATPAPSPSPWDSLAQRQPQGTQGTVSHVRLVATFTQEQN